MATRGETVINELLTKVGLLGVTEATAAAQTYDKVLGGVSVTSNTLTKSQLSNEKALTTTAKKYSEITAAAAELARVQGLVSASEAQGTGTAELRQTALAGATRNLTEALERQADAVRRVADAENARRTAVDNEAAAKAEEQTTAFNRLLHAIDPVAAATSNLAKVNKDLAASEKMAIGTAEQHGAIRAAQEAKVAAAVRAVQSAELDQIAARKTAMSSANDMVDSIRGVNTAHMASVPAFGKSGAAAAGVGKNFGLASHQVQNLAFQLNDLIVQIGSGQGLFRPLLQQGAQVQQILSMSEGGVGGVLKGVGGWLSRIGPLGWTAFGTAGVAGAVSLSTAALVEHGHELERQEAHLRAFSSRAEDVIAITKQVTAPLGLSDTGGFRDMTESMVRFGQALGVVDIKTFEANFANLTMTMGGTKEKADEAASAFGKLAAQGQLTSGDLIDFANKYHQFADVVARTLNVQKDDLLTMSRTIPVNSRNLIDAINSAGAAADANKRPWNELSSAMGSYWDSLSKATSQRWDAALDLLAQGIYNVIGAWTSAVDWLKSYYDWMVKILGLKTPQAPTTSGATPQAPGSDKDWRLLRPEGTSPVDWGSGGINTAPSTPTKSGPGAAVTADAVEKGVKAGQEHMSAEQKEYWNRDIGIGGEITGHTSDTSGFTSDTADNTGKSLREIHEGNLTRQAAEAAAQDERERQTSAARETSRYTNQTVEAVNALGDRIGRGTLASSSAFGHPGAFGDSIADANAQTFGSLDQMNNPTPNSGMGRPGQGTTQLGISIPLDVMLGVRKSSAGPDAPIGKDAVMSLVAQGQGYGFDSAKTMELYQTSIKENKKFTDVLEEASAAVDDLAKSSSSAAGEVLDLGDLGEPIQTQIDRLRDMQETSLQRTYKPDPYAEKNPDFYYNGEKIFRESQDKVYMGLQEQIVKLEGLQSTLAQLVTQGAYFPTAIVNAMQAAGFGDIAAQITNAFRSAPGAPPSATPAPTAVQTGTSPGTGTTTPVATKSSRTSFNSMSGWSNMYGV